MAGIICGGLSPLAACSVCNRLARSTPRFQVASLGALFLERQLLFAEWAHELPEGIGTTGTFPKRRTI